VRYEHALQSAKVRDDLVFGAVESRSPSKDDVLAVFLQVGMQAIVEAVLVNEDLAGQILRRAQRKGFPTFWDLPPPLGLCASVFEPLDLVFHA